MRKRKDFDMKKANIIILAGQSNAVGVGFTKYLPEHYDKETIDLFYRGFDNIPIWYVSHDIKSDEFVKTRVNCTEKVKDTLGPEVGIAKVISEAYPDEVFYIIKCAFGGSDVANDWRSPKSGVPFCEDAIPQPELAVYDPSYRFPGWAYNACFKLFREVFASLVNDGFEPCVNAFCWMQGESDTISERIGDYINRYDLMLADLREAFAPYFENCIYIDAGISEIWENYEQMNALKKEHDEKNGHIFIDTIGAGLTTLNEPYEEPDTYHYDLTSTLKLGELFGKAFIENRK